MAQRIGAVAYVENSALTKEGVRNVSTKRKCYPTHFEFLFEVLFDRLYVYWKHTLETLSFGNITFIWKNTYIGNIYRNFIDRGRT